jgi:anti-anti-sigma regulatory factor
LRRSLPDIGVEPTERRTVTGAPVEPRSFRLSEIESWPECREVIVEGSVDFRVLDQFADCLERLPESDNDYVIVDLDRCEFLDVVAIKQLVVAREVLSAQRCEMLIFGARDQMRRRLETVGAFDCDPVSPTVAGPFDGRVSALGAAARQMLPLNPSVAVTRLRRKLNGPGRR